MADTTRSRSVASPLAHRRRHTRRQPFDRRELERQGWQTTLEFRENHERDADGVLGAVTEKWSAEAERTDGDGDIVVVSSTGPNTASTWRNLRIACESTNFSSAPAAARQIAGR